MSKYNNVNPDHYKLAGRERPGKAVALKHKAKSTEAEERERWTERARQSDVRGAKSAGSETKGEGEGQKPAADAETPEARGEK